MNDEKLNPTFAQGETELFHAGETPAADYPFFPSAYCGAVMTGTRYDNRSDLPKDAELCATDAKRLGIDQPDDKPKIATPDKPAEKKADA